MRKYLAFFRLRFSMDLQYRAAAFAGVITQFVWGTMEILMFRAFYQADASAFPMSFQATVSYVWMQQAFLALFMAWMMENDIFDAILNGNIAYELCRPINIYRMWFARSLANRFAKSLPADLADCNAAACSLRADDAGKPGSFSFVFPDIASRHRSYGFLLYADLYDNIFYHLPHGNPYDRHFRSGIFIRSRDPSALFS